MDWWLRLLIVYEKVRILAHACVGIIYSFLPGSIIWDFWCFREILSSFSWVLGFGYSFYLILRFSSFYFFLGLFLVSSVRVDSGPLHLSLLLLSFSWGCRWGYRGFFLLRKAQETKNRGTRRGGSHNGKRWGCHCSWATVTETQGPSF